MNEKPADAGWIARLGLAPHPEGGFFRRIHTSPTMVGTARGERPLATSIYYLLTRDEPLGRLHRNRSDILHFLLDGGPLDYLTFDGRTLSRTRLDAQTRFLLVAGGTWKASRLAATTTHALISEVVTPGFDYADHEFARRDDLTMAAAEVQAELAPFLAAVPRPAT